MSGSERQKMPCRTVVCLARRGGRGKANRGFRLDLELKVLRLREGMADISGGEVIAMSDGLALIRLIALTALCG